jgi:hypothetical protein
VLWPKLGQEGHASNAGLWIYYATELASMFLSSRIPVSPCFISAALEDETLLTFNRVDVPPTDTSAIKSLAALVVYK